MAVTRVLGYNIVFKIGSKLIGATTSNSFDLTAETKDSITKEDLGVKSKVLTGYSYEFSAEGLVEVNSTGEVLPTRISSEDLKRMILEKQIATFTMHTAGSSVFYQGSCCMTKYSEKSDSENEATYSCSFGGIGQLMEEEVI